MQPVSFFRKSEVDVVFLSGFELTEKCEIHNMNFQ
jgi:hypothetical protein